MMCVIFEMNEISESYMMGAERKEREEKEREEERRREKRTNRASIIKKIKSLISLFFYLLLRRHVI
jgi:hypothetical protein